MRWVEVRRKTASGFEYSYWRRVMPVVPPAAINSSVFLYGSVEDARNRAREGGTGFLIAVSEEGPSGGWTGSPSAMDWRVAHPDRFYWLYVVTAAHCVVDKPSVAVWTGPPMEPMEIERDAWLRHPAGDDVAAYLLGAAADFPELYALAEDYLLLDGSIRAPSPGSEAFFVGRFIGHEARPTVRFGNVSMTPEPIRHDGFQIDQMSWLVEMRSLPGYSGSPVFVYDTEEVFELDAPMSEGGQIVRGGFQSIGSVWLLGVDWCHLYDTQDVLDAHGEPIEEGWYVRQNSGMMGVVPAQKIADILYDEEMIALRKDAEKKRKDKNGRKSGAEPDSQALATTREGFLADLRQAARRRSQEPSRSDRETN